MPPPRPTVMMRTRRTILAAIAAGLFAMGCAGQGTEPGSESQGPGTSTSPTSAPTPGPEPTATTQPSGSTVAPSSRAPTPNPSRTLSGGQIQVSGTIVAGVEPGCLLLDAGGPEQYLLIGGDKSVLRPGARVEVTGMPFDNVMSTCQQGRPLEVISATPL
jgi:hypothetical protein